MTCALCPAVCPQKLPQGYRFVRGKDQGGSDIAKLESGTWAELASECSTRSNCIMVNTLGWLKHTVDKPESEWEVLPQFANNPCGGMLVRTGEIRLCCLSVGGVKGLVVTDPEG